MAAEVAERSPLVYDLDWDEGARLGEWQDVLDDTRDLPVIALAAVLLDAWVGSLLAAAPIA